MLLLQALKLLREMQYLLSLLLHLLLKALLIVLLLLHQLLNLMLLLRDLPLKIAHRVNGGSIASRPAFAERSRPVRKRQQHVLGVIGQRALHKHDALESGPDAGSLQPLHALSNGDAQLVQCKQCRTYGESVADYCPDPLKRGGAIKHQGARHTTIASYRILK